MSELVVQFLTMDKPAASSNSQRSFQISPAVGYCRWLQPTVLCLYIFPGFSPNFRKFGTSGGLIKPDAIDPWKRTRTTDLNSNSNVTAFFKIGVYVRKVGHAHIFDI